MIRSFILLILTCFLGSCSREAGSSFSFDPADSVKVDESKTVITRFPSGMKEINDSVTGMVVNGQQISLYNISSGINVSNFSTQKFNFDSLVHCTYQKQYEGKRIYTYDAKTAGGLTDGNSQVLGFDHSEGAFYIYVNTLVDVNYDNDTLTLKKYENDPQLKAIKEKTGSYSLVVQDYLEFIFVTDEQFKIRSIIPLYERNALKAKDYFPYYQRTFAVQGNAIYAPILKNSETSQGISGKLRSDPGSFTLAKLDTKDLQAAEFRLSYKDIDFSDFSLNDFFSVPLVLKYNTNGLLFSNGKEICNTESAEKLFSKKALDAHEWISDFYPNSNSMLTLVTYTTAKKVHPSEMDLAYGIDSISSIHIKVFDKEKNTWLADKAVQTKTNPMFLVTNSKIIYIEKGKENYYFKVINYHAD
jgi:hypothetical protein